MHSAVATKTTPEIRGRDDGGKHSGAAKPSNANTQNGAAADETEPEQSVLPEDLMASLQSIEQKFDEFPASKRRVLLAEWMMKFHKRIGYFRCIYELTDAFIEVERGLTPSLFKPVERTGRPALPLIEEDRRSAAALAMEAFMRAGKSKQDAARTVARRLGYPAFDRGAWKTVAQRRDDLARAANGGGRYSEDFRDQAKIHEIQRAHLLCSIDERGENPRQVAEQELGRIDQIRETLNREKGEDFSSK